MATGLTFSLGGNSSSTRPPTATNGAHRQASNGVKRPHASLGDDSDDETTPSKQVVTHFSSKGAVNAEAPKGEKGPLVIKAQANRDWKESAAANKRAKYGIPQNAEKQTEEREAAIRKIEDAKKPVWGLNVKKGTNVEDAHVDRNSAVNTGTQADGEAPAVQNGTNGVNGAHADGVKAEGTPIRTDDQRAMDALLGVKQQSDLVISSVSEEEAFQRDYKYAPPQATMDEYTAMPVEEFGAALLRGMGWKEGHGIGNQSGNKLKKEKMPEKRPALLGIGAKEDAAVKEEIGAWGRGAKKRSDVVYNPIVMRNKRTGEELTEEEMKEKIQQQDIKDREADLEAIAAARKSDGHHHDRQKDKSRKHDYDSDEEYERRKRERRRERERDEKDDRRRKERRRSRDRDDGRDRRRDDRRDRESRRDTDDRDSHRRREDKDRRSREYDRHRRH